MKTYAEAEAYIAGGRYPQYRRRLPGRATELVRGHNCLVVMYHRTEVITYYPDKIVLNSGGWRTQTTKDRMNQYSPAHIFQENGLWYVAMYFESGTRTTLFYDGMEVDNAGAPLAPATCGQRHRLETAKRQVDKLVSRYIRGFVAHLRYVGHVEARGLGDCTNCHGQTFFRAANDPQGVDHLLMHLEEHYFVPSLFHNAIQERGYSNPQFIAELINSDLRRGDSNLYHVKHSLRTYFRKRKLALAELIVERGEV